MKVEVGSSAKMTENLKSRGRRRRKQMGRSVSCWFMLFHGGSGAVVGDSAVSSLYINKLILLDSYFPQHSSGILKKKNHSSQQLFF